MRLQLISGLLAVALPILTLAITIQEVPKCAQDCLANSTQSQTRCQVINIACLCQDPGYVSALSCCLATQCNSDEQATAIEFNQQECSNVNESAPNFVGCAPSNLASSLFLPPSSTAAATTLSTSTVAISTISGSLVSEPATFSGSPVTAMFDGRPLLTGSCTQPYFAFVTRAPDVTIQFPQIGCSPDQLECCPFPYGANGIITRCPQDHFTTAGGCCPLGYQMYYTNLGPQTPCYSKPSSTIVPATTLTGMGVILIMDNVFAQRYVLGTAAADTAGLSAGAWAGIGVGAGVAFFGSIGALWFWRRRKIKQITEPHKSTTFPPVEPTFPMSEASQPQVQSPQELASPEQPGMSPRSPRSPRLHMNFWPVGLASSPPAYDAQRAREESIKGQPQELPGSTYIHEHHPAFAAGQDLPSPTSPSTPKTPTRSFTGGSEPGSPLVTPSSSAAGAGNAPRSPPIVSPLNSPKLPPNRRT